MRAYRLPGWLAGVGVWIVFFQLLSPAWGLTLGAMDVRSYQGEPLNATITITLAGKESVLNLVASKATPQDYAPLHLEYHEQVSALQLDLDGQGGQRKLSIKSKTPITTPFFNFLLKLSTGQGDHFRNYPVFLEVRPSALSADFQPSRPIVSPLVSDLAPANKGEYGPVQPGETLLKIAEKYPMPPLTRQQVAVAFYETNKTQFIDSNISNLPAGVILKVPDKARVADLNAEHAKSEKVSKATGGDKENSGKSSPVSESVAGTRKTDATPSSEPKVAEVTIVRSKPTVARAADETTATKETTPPQDTKANAVTKPSGEGTAAPPSTPAPVIDKVEVDNLKQSVATLNDQLKASEEVRTRLQGQLGLLENRLKKLEQQPKTPPPAPVPQPTPIDIPWDMVGIGGGALALLLGLLGYLRRRRQTEPKQWTLRFSHRDQPPRNEPTPPPVAPTMEQVIATTTAALATLPPQEDPPIPVEATARLESPPSAITKEEEPPSETEGVVDGVVEEVVEEEDSPGPVRSVADIISGTRTVLPASSRSQEPLSNEDDSLSTHIVELGSGDRDEGDSIFNLDGRKEDVLEGAAPSQVSFTRDSDSLIDLGNEDDSPASIFNFDRQSTPPLQNIPEPEESMVVPATSLVEMGVEEGSATDAITSEITLPKTAVADGALEVEALVFEVPVITENIRDPLPQATMDPNVETIQFDVTTTPNVNNSGQSAGGKKGKQTSQPVKTTAPIEDDMPVLELIDEQKISGGSR